jgi:hypothetical protein
MTTRTLTAFLSFLGALLFAAAAHAGDFSMDAGSTTSEPVSSSSGRHGDCASAGSSVIGVVDASRDSSHSSTSAASNRVAAGTAGTSSADSTPGGSGTATEVIGVPLKTRSNRWQSLVPGAIK